MSLVASPTISTKVTLLASSNTSSNCNVLGVNFPPIQELFTLPNVDIPVGHLTRIRINSGIVIEESPFEFKFQSNKVLSEIPFPRGIIKTILYEL